MNFDELQNYAEEIYNNLLKLIETPGPSGSCARIINYHHMQSKEGEPPMTARIKEIVESFERPKDKSKIKVIEDNGNIVLVGGLSSENPSEDEIKNIPIVLGAHADEITYLITNKRDEDFRVLTPLCSPPTRAFYPKYHPFEHEEAQILGFREGKLKTIGYGTFHAKMRIKTKRNEEVEMEGWNYLLKEEKIMDGEEIIPGDIAIQNYILPRKFDGLKSVIEAKALDDRVGTIVVLYAMRFLCSYMPIKAILSGDEEGVPRDVAWARLILPTYQQFCKEDVITILCDGINGADLFEFYSEEGKYLSEALLVPFTASGKGGGDYRLFSSIAKKIIPICRGNNFGIRVTTDYVSRSFDPKIMNEYPLITFIDWSNGLVGNKFFRCHYHEEILFEQVLNLIGSIFWTARYLYENRPLLGL